MDLLSQIMSENSYTWFKNSYGYLSIEDVIIYNRLRWFGYLQRMG